MFNVKLRRTAQICCVFSWLIWLLSVSELSRQDRSGGDCLFSTQVPTYMAFTVLIACCYCRPSHSQRLINKLSQIFQATVLLPNASDCWVECRRLTLFKQLHHQFPHSLPVCCGSFPDRPHPAMSPVCSGTINTLGLNCWCYLVH